MHVYILSNIKYFLNVLMIVDFTTNVAVGKPTEMSSRQYDYYPVYAVDGSHLKWSSRCATTPRKKPTVGNWWKVHLDAMYDIKMVMIVGLKHCCGETETLTLCKIIFMVYTGGQGLGLFFVFQILFLLSSVTSIT